MRSSPQNVLLSASLASVSSLVLLQLFSRLLTFALNQALVRLASPQIFGTATIQLELLLSTILFLCREGVRSALLRERPSLGPRQRTDASIDSQEDLATNISILPTLLGIPATTIITLLYLYSSATSTTSQPYFHVSVVLYSLAAFLELLSEPLYIKAQNQLRFDVRVRAEGTSIVSKTVVTFIILVLAPTEWALVAFAAGQCAYSMSTLVSYLRFYGKSHFILFRGMRVVTLRNKDVTYFDKELLRLSAAMTAQSAVKHFLTEGDKFLVSRLSPLADQGGYAVASNYGSLVARIIFLPIEETSRVFFSKALSSSLSNTADTLQTTSQVLLSLLLFFAHFSLFLVVFGPPYFSLAVSIILPSRYRHTSAPLILHAYIYYIPTMAFNGLLEAFFASVSTPFDLRSQSRWMMLCSIVYVVIAVGLAHGLGWGDAGLVWANIANLGVRAVYAWSFARRFFRQQSGKDLMHWRKVIPPSEVLFALTLAGGLTRWSERAYHDLPPFSQLSHMALGTGCVAGCILVCFIFERTIFRETFVIIRGNK